MTEPEPVELDRLKHLPQPFHSPLLQDAVTPCDALQAVPQGYSDLIVEIVSCSKMICKGMAEGMWPQAVCPLLHADSPEIIPEKP